MNQTLEHIVNIQMQNKTIQLHWTYMYLTIIL